MTGSPWPLRRAAGAEDGPLPEPADLALLDGPVVARSSKTKHRWRSG